MKKPNKIKKLINYGDPLDRETIMVNKVNEVVDAVNEIYNRFEKARIALDEFSFSTTKKQRSPKNV